MTFHRSMGFLIPKPAPVGSPAVVIISVVLNWLEELKRLMPNP